MALFTTSWYYPPDFRKKCHPQCLSRYFCLKSNSILDRAVCSSNDALLEREFEKIRQRIKPLILSKPQYNNILSFRDDIINQLNLYVEKHAQEPQQMFRWPHANKWNRVSIQDEIAYELACQIHNEANGRIVLLNLRELDKADIWGETSEPSHTLATVPPQPSIVQTPVPQPVREPALGVQSSPIIVPDTGRYAIRYDSLGLIEGFGDVTDSGSLRKRKAATSLIPERNVRPMLKNTRTVPTTDTDTTPTTSLIPERNVCPMLENARTVPTTDTETTSTTVIANSTAVDADSIAVNTNFNGPSTASSIAKTKLQERLAMLDVCLPYIADNNIVLTVDGVSVSAVTEENVIFVNDLMKFYAGPELCCKMPRWRSLQTEILSFAPPNKWVKIKNRFAIPVEYARKWAETVGLTAVIDILEELLDPNSVKGLTLRNDLTCDCTPSVLLQMDNSKAGCNAALRHLREDQVALRSEINENFFICWSHGVAFATKTRFNKHQAKYQGCKGLLSI